MALKYPFMVKTVKGQDLELQAKTGESILVKDIMVSNPSSDFATVSIDKTTVGYFMVGGVLGNHLHYPNKSITKCSNLLKLLFDEGIFKGYPVAEGQTFKVTGCVGANTEITVIYEVYDAGDIKAEMENGTNADKYLYINYATTGEDISAAGDYLYDNPLNPAEFPDFPFGKDVPAKTLITIYGIAASDVSVSGASASTDYVRTKYLKMIKERTVLFDELKNGILHEGSVPTDVSQTNIGKGYSLIGNFSDVDWKKILWLPQPLKFEAGEELGIYLTTEVAGAGALLSQDLQRIALIEVVERVR